MWLMSKGETEIYYVSTMTQAELLATITAYGNSPMQLDRKRSVLSRAVAENTEAAALIPYYNSIASVLVHPIADYPTSASPAVHTLQVQNSGHQPGAVAMYRHNHFGSGVLPRPAVSTPASLVC